MITYGSVIYFCDTRMKTKDWSFAGFPACWNMFILVMFALKPGEGVILACVIALTIAMFTNLKFVHPTRTQRWKAITLPMSLAWTFFAGWAAWVDFHPASWAHWGLVVTSLYLTFAGIVQEAIPERTRGA